MKPIELGLPKTRLLIWVVVKIRVPFCVPYIIRCRIIFRTQKGTLILTTTHIPNCPRDCWYCKSLELLCLVAQYKAQTTDTSFAVKTKILLLRLKIQLTPENPALNYPPVLYNIPLSSTACGTRLWPSALTCGCGKIHTLIYIYIYIFAPGSRKYESLN